MVAITIAVAAWSLYDARQGIRRNAEQQTGNITLALAHEIERTVSTLDLSLRATVGGMNIAGLASMPSDIQQAILFDGALGAAGFRGIFILDENGDVLFHSKTSMPPDQGLSDRGYFQKHKQSPGDQLIISGPVRSRADGNLLEILSRRITRPDGSFGGVAVAEIQLDYFEGLFSHLKLDTNGIVLLLTTDGRLITHRPLGDDDFGRDIRGGEVFSHYVKAPAGSFEAVAEADKVKRIFDYQQIRDLPLIISVGLSTAELYADWQKRAEILSVVLCLLTGLFFYSRHALQHVIRQRLAAEQGAKEAQAVAEHLAVQVAEEMAKRDALINNTADAMIVARIDEAGEFFYEAVNPVWEHLFGLRAATVINRRPVDCLPAPVAKGILSGWEECARSRVPVRFPFCFPRGDNGQQHWEALVCPVLSINGEVKRIIGVARNVTEQRNLEEKLRYAQRMEAVGELTAGIAHDFNNLLQSMLGSLEVAEEQPGLDEDGHLCIRLANEAAKRAASLVHQLLAFSSKQRLNPTLVKPHQFGQQIARAIESVLGANYYLAADITADAGPVLADEDQLSECLINMALNARDATPHGGYMRLRICNTTNEEVTAAGMKPGGYTQFILEDEGTGMPPDVLARAFEPFFTTKDIGKGTGLGLSMVQGFARQSGGDVTIESVVGVGTVVSLWLPRSGEVERQPPSTHEAAPAGLPIRRRVLVVDDEAPVRQTLSLFLRRAGYQPVLAETGEEALSLLRQSMSFNLLVTDQSMPGMTGTTLIEEVYHMRPMLPTMLITGYERVSGIERLQGRVKVLNKPFERTQFLHQVQALLGTEAPCGDLADGSQSQAESSEAASPIPLRNPTGV